MSFRIPYNGAGIAFLKENNDSFSIFMGKRSRPPFFSSWSIPGGSIEKKLNEDELTGAKRELKEETGIELSNKDTYLGKWTMRFLFFKWTTFFYKTNRDFSDSVPNEFFCLKWVYYPKLYRYYKRPFTHFEMKKGKKLLIQLRNHCSQ